MVDFFQPWWLYAYIYVVLALVALIAASEHFSAKQVVWIHLITHLKLNSTNILTMRHQMGPFRVIMTICVSLFLRAIWAMLKPEVDTDSWGMRLVNRLVM